MLLKELGIYDTAVTRLQAFITAISPSTIETEEEGTAAEVVTPEVQVKESPAEKLLREKSEESSEEQSIRRNETDIKPELAIYSKLAKPP